MGTIFGPKLTYFGQSKTKVNVESLLLNVSMFNHGPPWNNVFYFIQEFYGIQELILIL